MIEQTEIAESAVDPEEISSASGIIRSLIKAIKAFKIYLPNNPLHQKFFEQLQKDLAVHLSEFGDMKLEVEQFEIKLEGVPIYENHDTKESLAFKLNSDGIISLTLSEGIDDKEISTFLEIIGKERPFETDDDIVTQLWTENLSHITYVVSEDTEDELDANSIGNGRESSTKQKEDIKSAHSEIPTTPPPPSPMKVPQSILFLSDDEIAWLKQMKEFEETRKPVEDVLNIITAILSSPLGIPLFEDFLDVTTALMINLIKSGEVGSSLKLILFINDLEKHTYITTDHIELISSAKKGLFSYDMIEALKKIIDKTDKIEPGQLKTIILMFGKDAVRPTINLLGASSKKDMRKSIIEGLVEIGKDVPEEFFPCLKDERWYLARNAVLILRLIGDPLAVKEISLLISHSDPRVRKEVLLFMQSISDEAAMKAITRFLNDENSSLRRRALKLLISFKYKAAFKAISTIIRADDFEEREIRERQLFIEALGELGQEEAIPLLSEMLTTKYWLNKLREKEVINLAISGLRKIPPAAALKVLTEAKASKKGEIADLIELAIKTIVGRKK